MICIWFPWERGVLTLKMLSPCVRCRRRSQLHNLAARQSPRPDVQEVHQNCKLALPPQQVSWHCTPSLPPQQSDSFLSTSAAAWPIPLSIGRTWHPVGGVWKKFPAVYHLVLLMIYQSDFPKYQWGIGQPAASSVWVESLCARVTIFRLCSVCSPQHTSISRGATYLNSTQQRSFQS